MEQNISKMSITGYLGNTGLRNLEFVRTGDILLFSNEPQRGSLLIMTTTRSRWTHTGIAVWRNRKLMLFESTFGSPALDELTGEVRKGVRLTELSEILSRYNTIHIRPSNIERTSEFYTKLDEFMELWKGKPYVSFIKIPFIPYFKFEDPGVSCSELVARYFDYIGLFDGKPELQNFYIKNYLPYHFAPQEFAYQGPDTESLFKQTFSPIVYQKEFMTFDSVKLLVAITILVTLLGFYIHLR